jgi:hypothetical protein
MRVVTHAPVVLVAERTPARLEMKRVEIGTNTIKQLVAQLLNGVCEEAAVSLVTV